MARQDQTIRYSVDVDGNKDLLAIADGLNTIAKSSSDAAPAATALLEQLKSLASQNNLVTSLVNDKASLVDLGNELFLAKQKAADLQATFAATEAPTAAMSRALTNANASVASLETQYSALSLTITKGSLALAAAGVDSENLDAAQRGLQASIAGVRAESAGLATSFEAAAAAGQAEALTMSEIADRSEILRAGFTQLKTLLGTFAGIVAFEQIKNDIGEVLETGDKFAKFGQQFAAAFGGADQGVAALEKVKAIADQTPLSLDEVTKAALQAKKEGLDPFDGSLQTLIDTTTKFGGGSDQLNTLIAALGKSANQGGLNIRTLASLEQQGIPAAQLLGAALGKTADQVTDLAKNSKLGADSVKTLITALSKNSTGAAAGQFDLLSTQVTKAKDNYDDFLKLIAQSGVYQTVVDELKNLNAQFKAGLEDGSLQSSAKSISDSLVSMGQALLSVTKFAFDHAGAIKEVVEDYVLFKAALLGADLIGAAQNFLTLAAATKATATAAAEAAGTGAYGKLIGVLGQIPRNIQIAIAVAGAAEAIDQFITIADIAKDTVTLMHEQTQARADDAALAEKLAVQAKQVADANIASAQTQIASADDLAAKNRQQSADYITSLQGALKYYTALQVQDKQLGDSAGAKAAGDKVTALSAALNDAVAHAQDVSASIKAMDDAVESVIDRFIELRTTGATSLQAIEGAFKNVDFTTPVALDETLQIIQKLSGLSDDAAVAVQSELAVALTKLDAADLGDFQKNVSDKIKAAGTASQEAAIAIKASLQAELLELGLSAEQAQVTVTAAGQKIIDTFTNISNNASASANTIQLAFAQALTKVTTTGEVQALETQLKTAFDAGKLSADQFAASMQAAGRKAADLQADAIVAAASLDGMGTAGQDASLRIVQALEDAKDKIAVQAAAIAKSIADGLQSGSDVTDLKAKLAEAESEIAEFDARIANAGSAGNKSINQLTKSTGDLGDATQNTNQQVSEATLNAEKGFTEWGDAADAAALATAKVTTDTSHANEAMDALTQGIANARAGFLAVSAAAGAFYDQTLKAVFEITPSLDGAGFDRTAAAMTTALDVVTKKINDQRTALANEIAVVNEVGTSGQTNFGQFGDSAAAAEAKMTALATAIQNGSVDAGLLGQQELQPLQAALEAAAQRAQQLVDQIAQANDQLNQLASDTQDALDEEEGNQAAIEDRRHQKELDDLQAAAKAANQLNSQVYLQAVQQENQLHQLKLKNLAAQQAAQNGSGSGSGTSSDTSAQTTGAPGIGSGSASTGGGTGFGVPNVTIHVAGSVIGGTVDDIVKALTPVIIKNLKSVQSRTIGPLLGK